MQMKWEDKGARHAFSICARMIWERGVVFIGETAASRLCISAIPSSVRLEVAKLVILLRTISPASMLISWERLNL